VALVTVVDDDAQLATTSALRITTLIELAVAARESAVICLTGGRTPERLYDTLADERQPWRSRIDWSRVHVFWGDERHVPPDHPDSNFGMAHRTLLSRVPIPQAQIHRIEAERPDAREAARSYEAEVRDRTFDVMLLGLGEDAHIASIFPGSPLIDERSVRVAAAWAPHLRAWRITLTPPALLDARAILMMTSGAKKADAVRAALELPEDVMRYPAQILRRADDRAEWVIDRAAARSLAAPPAQ
jgi:6-phosphogluconolactonase